jgi:hypothetical protein
MKPVVHYINDVDFHSFEYKGEQVEVARCQAVDHPRLGFGIVHTSQVIKKEEDGTFETLNTIYKPLKGN